MNFYANQALCALFRHARRRLAEGDARKETFRASKLLRVMKLTTFIILVTCLQTSATGVAQQTITFSGKEVSLENVFAAIKKQTNYKFFFNIESIQHAQKVTLEVKNASIEQVLHLALKDQPFTFTIKGRTVFIIKKNEEEKSSSFTVASGDPVTVTGRVTDDQGQPLVGANVKIKGSMTGTTTDKDGMFKLPNVDQDASLEISFVGHETQVVPVRGKAFFTINLAQKLSLLDETQVIAYGTTTRRFNTGNVSSVKASDIEKQPVNNPLLALEGRVPGLFITQNTGVPGGGITVRIQGQNSIQSGNDPLYVIDGVPYNSQIPKTGLGDNILGNSGQWITRNAVTTGIGNPLSYINPYDIESIEVLKDADATAIYGSRAANGAILITTKKGKSGTPKVDFNIQQGWGNVGRRMKMLNTRQYLDMRYEALKNDGININTVSSTSFRYYDLKVWDTTRYTDWQKVLIGGTASYTNLSGTISGGTNNIQYLIGGTYHRETTVFPSNFSDEKASLHLNINSFSANRKFHFQFTSNYMLDNNQLPQNDLTNAAILFEPDAPPLFNADGTLNWQQLPSGTSTFSNNPMASLMNTYRNKTNNLVSNSLVGYQIFPGFEIQSNFGYTKMQSEEFNAFPLSAVQPASRPYTPRIAQYGIRDINSWSIEPQITYQKSIARGKINLLAGSSIQQYRNNGFAITALGFSNDNVLENISGATSVSSQSGFQSEYRYNALFGRINYNLNNKYIFNLNWRRDGSSRFGENSQFHNFWSIGGAWIFSEEKLFQDAIPVISFGKIRASYGTTGNDLIGDYIYLNLYNNVNPGVPYQSTSGLAPGGLANPYLEWEETKKFCVGVDLGLIKDRLLFDLTYARNQSSNQLLDYILPQFTGFASVTTNFPATIKNTSWEFSLNSKNINSKNIGWTTSFNLTIPQNKLVKFPGLESSSYASYLIVGQSLSVQRVYHFLGVDPTTGHYIVADKQGNATSSPDYNNDRNALINTLPKFYGAIQNSLNFKGFQLDFIFQFVKQLARNYKFGNGFRYPGQFFRGGSNQPASVINHWQKIGDIATVQRYSSTSFSYIINAIGSDAYYSDASYIRLKNVSLSYCLPQKWIHTGHIRDCRIYIQGQNLMTITSYSGLDPETQSLSSLPPLRELILGIQLGL